MINNLSRPRTMSQRLTLVGAILLVTVIAFGLAMGARQIRTESLPLSWEEVTAFEYDPYLIGYLFQGIVVPVVLIYLFSTTRVFRRIVSGKVERRDSLKLFAALALIQLFVLAFDLWRVVSGGEPGSAVLGLLVKGLPEQPNADGDRRDHDNGHKNQTGSVHRIPSQHAGSTPSDCTTA